MTYTHKTKGICSSSIELEVEDGIAEDITFWGGCNGNLQGLSRLVTRMSVNEVIPRLEGIRCSGRPTPCPDQLRGALREMGYQTIVAQKRLTG